MVDHPGGEGQRRVQQGVANCLRPGGHFDEVAVSGLPEGGDLLGCGAFLVGVCRHGLAERGHEQVGVDADQALGGQTAQRIRDAGAHVAALRDVARVAETAHQLGPGARRTTQIPAELHRLAREPVPGQGRQHKMEAVIAAPTVRGRVR